jgi:hypothetical protein
MWQVTQNGHNIVLAAHIDDFVMACADRPTLDSFRSRLLEVFDGTYEGWEMMGPVCTAKDFLSGVAATSMAALTSSAWNFEAFVPVADTSAAAAEPALVSFCIFLLAYQQHYVRIRQHTSAYVSIR